MDQPYEIIAFLKSVENNMLRSLVRQLYKKDVEDCQLQPIFYYKHTLMMADSKYY